jgi:hypothetical protein
MNGERPLPQHHPLTMNGNGRFLTWRLESSKSHAEIDRKQVSDWQAHVAGW